MVYVSEETYQSAPTGEIPILVDPALLRAARRLYRTYCILHPRQNRRPHGIAIHRNTHRGQLIFSVKPILLPGECFVSTKQLEGERNQYPSEGFE